MSEPYEFACPNCGQTIREKTLGIGALKRCRACHETIVIPAPPPDLTPFGAALAERVADYLLTGQDIPSRHPYFAGVALAYCRGEFLYGYAEEGGAPAFMEQTPVLARFPDRASFVTWLAVQRDGTLPGPEDANTYPPGGQRITRQLIESMLRSSRPVIE